MNFEEFRRKHDENDLTVFEDFRCFLLNLNESDIALVKIFWREFPNATWTRACGFLVEELVQKKKYLLMRMFWDHDMFRMGGQPRAEELKHLFYN